MPSRSHPASVSLRASACMLCLAGVLALATCAPAAVAAGLGSSSALNKLTEEQEPETTTTTAPAGNASMRTTQPTSSSIVIMLLAGAAVVLIGIGYVIMRDVRRVAPATATEMIEASSARRSETAMRKRRAKAKAARRQRKRNR